MPAPSRRGTLWIALAIALIALLSNVAFFVAIPGQAALTWIGLALTVLALGAALLGILRAFRAPHTGMIGSSLLAAVVLFFVAGSAIGFFQARNLPKSPHAPAVGERAPDFSLPDTTGRMTSLSDLLAPGGARPRAVLLVFYRGWW
jgi:hypothetical protein